MNLDRTKVTFEQAEGKQDLPSQLSLGELSEEARALLWAIVYDSLNKRSSYDNWAGHATFDDESWPKLLQREHVTRLHLPLDAYSEDVADHVLRLKKLLFKGEYWEVLGWIQWTLRTKLIGTGFAAGIDLALKNSRAAYRLTDDGLTIAPYATEEEGGAILTAFETVKASGLSGAADHLRHASDLLNEGDWDGSCRESIHAVESVARLIDPDASKDLKLALRKLEEKEALHPALRAALNNLYGYTSDEKGIRHAKLNDPSNVTQHEALFFLGTCASGVTYLVNRAREKGLIE